MLFLFHLMPRDPCKHWAFNYSSVTSAKNSKCLCPRFLCPYIIGVDVPGHVAIGDQLTVDIASDFRVPPAVVDVDDANHVPLKDTKAR